MSLIDDPAQPDRRFLILGGGATLFMAGCSTETVRQPQPSFYRNLASPSAQVDVPMAASMITGFRGNNGRGAVMADPTLTRIAAQHAALMAANDQVGSNPPLSERLVSAGLPGGTRAVENVSAGYMTLAEAFSGWRDSPPHKTNMLNPTATRIGLGTSFRPGSKYRVFWCLILA